MFTSTTTTHDILMFSVRKSTHGILYKMAGLHSSKINKWRRNQKKEKFGWIKKE